MNRVDYKNACRICLVDGASIPIFEKSPAEYRNLSQKLCICFGEKVVDCKGYPRNICEICYLKLSDLFTFRDKYFESCKILAKNLVVVKQEPDDNYDDYNENDILDINEFEVKVEGPAPKSSAGCSKTKHVKPKIVFNNAQQFVELIKPVIKTVKKEPTVAAQEKQPRKKTGVSKKSTTIKKIKKKKKIEDKISKDKDIATAILEGQFVFNGESWEFPSKKINSTENEDKDTENNEKQEVNKKDRKDKQDSRLCDTCGATFDTADKLYKHVFNHRSSQTSKCTCHHCGRVLGDTSSLKRHIEGIHGVKDKICQHCGKAFGNKKILDDHIKRVHLKLKRQATKRPCHMCGKLLCNNKALLMHMRSFHTGERPAACTVCDARFAHEDYLRDHMRLHTGETPFKCPVCDRGYAQRCNMKSHISHNHHISALTESQLKTIHPRYLRLMKP